LNTALNPPGTTARHLWPAARTSALLAAAGLASVSMVNLPNPSWASTAIEPPASYVPASDKWITLGSGTAGERPPLPGGAVEQLSNSLREQEPTGRKRKPRGFQLAPLGSDTTPQEGVDRALAGGRVRWGAAPGCRKGTWRRVIAEVSRKFGPLTIDSTCRSRRHNAKRWRRATLAASVG
jgi:hypothetical protein